VTERTGVVTFQGMPLTLVGDGLSAGAKAPDFSLLDNDLGPVSLSDYKGKVCLLVCDMETRRFNEEASGLGAAIAVVGVSMDLPFAQKRWCGAAGIEQVKTLSDHLHASFGEAYGVLVKELRLLARAVFVIDQEGTVRYEQIVGEMVNEPDYEAALSAAKKLVNG